ncbi:unnamed protein product [Miscanthus lutarioriparius]|uniref:Uncharacterized protein n=1 Tax=Miscanthus lutarioriparius TaxID=422564 RepID=A0A811MBE8_9POAL|nr:unnamed protein product [Miscanthus lutarioriparius]
MLEKFPKAVEPAWWWPRRRPQQQPKSSTTTTRSRSFGRRGVHTTSNGWSQELEEEMRSLLRVLRDKDEHQYLTVGKLVVSINRGLAVAVAAAFIGTGDGAWASAGHAVRAAARIAPKFYRKVQEDIEAAYGDADVERRENGEVFRTKVALLLGRDVAELRQFRRMASASVKDDDIKDYAGKLF